MKKLIFIAGVVSLLYCSGCAIHRQPKLTQSEMLLLNTPAHQNHAPTPRPEDF